MENAVLSIFLWILGGIAVYCLLCWIIGFSLYFAGRVHPELTRQSTVFAPIMPIALVGCWLQDTKFRLHVRKMRRVSRWIAESLSARGIKVNGNYGASPSFETCGENGTIYINIPDGYDAIHDYCEVRAEPKSEQIAAYQDVYAAAIRKFWWLTPAQVCGGAIPPKPLNREWASRIGITEYFAEELFVPCVECGAQKPWHRWLWGDEVSHAKLHWADIVTEYHLRDGTTGTIRGRLCDVCEKRLDYTSATSYFAK